MGIGLKAFVFYQCILLYLIMSYISVSISKYIYILRHLNISYLFKSIKNEEN